jgi:hypothetical protein
MGERRHCLRDQRYQDRGQDDDIAPKNQARVRGLAECFAQSQGAGICQDADQKCGLESEKSETVSDTAERLAIAHGEKLTKDRGRERDERGHAMNLLYGYWGHG